MSTRAADTFGFFSMMIRVFHSSASSVLVWGDSQSSSSSYGQTAPGYYSSYSHTSGGSVSFPSLGGIFSLAPRASPSDQSLSQGVKILFNPILSYSFGKILFCPIFWGNVLFYPIFWPFCL